MPHGDQGVQLDNQTQMLEIGERTNREYLRFVPQREELYQNYGESFINRNLSEAERNAKKNNARSDLYKKRANAILLHKTATQRQYRQRVLIQECMADRLVQCPDDEYRDIASFMASQNTNRNKKILDCYFGKPNQQNPHVAEGQNINKALGMMAFELFRIDISQLRLTNDEELVGHALVLEQLSDQVGALDRLLDKHPAFMDGWTKRKKKLFHQRMNTLRSIALYYQTRKTIMNDRYYQDHFEDELSMEIRPEDTPEQQELAKKLIQSYVFEKAMIHAGTAQVPGNLIHNSTITLREDISRQYLLSLKMACTQRLAQKNFIRQSRLSVSDASYRQKARNEHKALFDKAAVKSSSMRHDYLINRYVRMSPAWMNRHLSDDNLRYRTMKIASCMAYLRKDDESTSFGMLDDLLLRTDVLKTAGKIKKARAYEKLFDFVRNYDLKQFEYSTNEACFQSRYLKPHVMGVMMKSLPKEYFDDYLGLMKDPKAECAMKPHEVYEVMARWTAIRGASNGNLPAGTSMDTLLQPERAKYKLDESDRIREKQRDMLEYRRQQLLAEKHQAVAPAQEMEDIQQNMNNVQGRGFVTVQRPDHRIGIFGKLRNLALLGIRGVVRGISSLIGGAGISQTYQATVPAYNWLKSDAIENAQRKRRHDIVPGRDMEFFDDEEMVAKDEQGEDLEVYSDVRRGPLVWEKMTAGDPDDPPEVCIMTEQPVRGSQMAIGGAHYEQGHALITLSYSRYSKLTKRKERYQLRMGFYNTGKTGIQSKGAMVAGAYVGGIIKSDEEHEYDVSRRYVVKPGDINKILKKAETYADGGYNLFQRNCSTFVIDMAREINLPLEEIYKEEQPQLNILHQAALEAGAGVANLTQFGGASDIISRLDKDDLSYHNFGQKMYTKEDLDRFYRTFNTGDIFKTGYNPGLLGEDLRKAKNGILSARLKEHLYMDKEALLERQDELANSIWTAITQIIPDEQRNDQDDQIHAMLILTKDAGYFNETEKGDRASADNFRRIHRRIRNVSTGISRYYTDRLSSDNRLNESILEYLSILEVIQTKVDKSYRASLKNETRGNTGGLQFDFYRNEYTLAYKKGPVLMTADLTAADYEGFLMANYTPEQIVRMCKRYVDLIALGENLTAEQKKEKNKLRRIHQLAKDFAGASRYLMDKDEYTVQDLCYAFRDLPRKEARVTAAGDTVSGDMLDQDSRPSYFYQCVMLDKMVFGDFRQLNLHEVQGIDAKKTALDTFMQNRLDTNRNHMRTILRYYTEGKEGPAENLVRPFLTNYIRDCMKHAYLDTGMNEETCEGIAAAMADYSDTITRIIEMTEELRAEQQQQQQQ